MSSAICIPFHRYQPHGCSYYLVYQELLLKNLEYINTEFDHLYLIDQEWEFERDFIVAVQKIIPTTVVNSVVTGHHWNQFKAAIPQIKEDYILFMDNDVVFYRSGVINKWFKQAEESDIVTAFDGSGGLQQQIWKTYPQMKEMNATRMGSYYFILNQNLIKDIPDFSFEPITYTLGTYLKELDYTTKDGDWSDSFGLFTLKWLHNKNTFSVIEDDRSTLYLQDDNTFSKQPENSRDLGYYHIRNGNLPVYQLTSKYCGHLSDYQHSLHITPRRETLRILAWYRYIMGESNDVLGIVNDLQVPYSIWDNYITECIKYYKLKE